MMGKDRLMILGDNPLFSTMALGVPWMYGGWHSMLPYIQW